MVPVTRVRPSWDDYFFDIVEAAAARATCDRGRCGAVLVVKNQVIATGYVGSPPGFEHCDDVGHDMVDGHCVRTVHAEANAVASAARRGVMTLGATLYCTMVPCRSCAMLLLASGVCEVYAQFMYQKHDGLDLLNRAGVYTHIFNDWTPYAT